jgi:hypothetical protein
MISIIIGSSPITMISMGNMFLLVMAIDDSIQRKKCSETTIPAIAIPTNARVMNLRALKG